MRVVRAPRSRLAIWLVGSLAVHAAVVLAAPVHLPRAGPTRPALRVALAPPVLRSEPAAAPSPAPVAPPLPTRRPAKAPAQSPSAGTRTTDPSAPVPPKEMPQAAPRTAAASSGDLREPEPDGPDARPASFDIWGKLLSIADGQGALFGAGEATAEPREATSDDVDAGSASDAAGVDDSAPGEGGTLVAPAAHSMARPAYPEAERRVGREGTVHLRLLVNSAGAVERVAIARSSGRESFDEAARKAAEAWRFRPAYRGETPISAWVIVPVEFRLEDAD